jgi:transcriptional regulator with XRE-family HTH domain
MWIYTGVNLHSDDLSDDAGVSSHRVKRTTLADRVREARTEKGWSMNALDRKIGQGDGGYTTRIESGEKKNPEIHILERMADELGVRRAWLVLGEEPKRGADVPDKMMSWLLLKLHRLPGLHEWVESHPMRISELVRVLMVYEDVKPRSREDGQPLGGWGAFVEDALHGRLDGPKVPADRAAAMALEAKQMRDTGHEPKAPTSRRGRKKAAEGK